MGPKYNDIHPCKRGSRNFERQTCRDEGNVEMEAGTGVPRSQAKDANSHQGLDEEGNGFSLKAQNTGPCQHIYLELLASRTVRARISDVFSHQVYGNTL